MTGAFYENDDEIKDTLGEVCYLLFNLIGRTQAYEIYLQSLTKMIVEKNPELLELLKEDFSSVSELQQKFISSKVTLDSFNETVTNLSNHFLLMKGGGFFKEKSGE